AMTLWRYLGKPLAVLPEHAITKTRSRTDAGGVVTKEPVFEDGQPVIETVAAGEVIDYHGGIRAMMTIPWSGPITVVLTGSTIDSDLATYLRLKGRGDLEPVP